MCKANQKTMDKKIGSTSHIYRQVYITAYAVILVFFEIYLLFCLFLEKNLGTIPLTKNSLANEIISVIISMIVSSVFSLFIYKCVYSYKEKKWIRDNKELWIKGTWFCIHIKDTIRIGKIEIQQNFNTIAASCMNIALNTTQESIVDLKITNWKYYVAKIRSAEDGPDLIGCYNATNSAGISNDGIHSLNLTSKDKDGFPNQFSGFFSDTFKTVNGSTNTLNIADHSGQLFLFKPTKDLLEHLTSSNGGFDYQAFSNLHNNPRFASEEFVIKLKEILELNTKTT